MVSVKGVVLLALAAAIGLTFLVLSCCAKERYNWWPMFTAFFYALAPIPTMLYRRAQASYASSPGANVALDITVFITTGLVVSAFALPIVLANSGNGAGGDVKAFGVILWEQTAFVMAGNITMFTTILCYFLFFTEDDNSW